MVVYIVYCRQYSVYIKSHEMEFGWFHMHSPAFKIQLLFAVWCNASCRIRGCSRVRSVRWGPAGRSTWAPQSFFRLGPRGCTGNRKIGLAPFTFKLLRVILVGLWVFRGWAKLRVASFLWRRDGRRRQTVRNLLFFQPHIKSDHIFSRGGPELLCFHRFPKVSVELGKIWMGTGRVYSPFQSIWVSLLDPLP